MRIVHINKDYDKVKDFAEQLVRKWEARDKKKAETKYFKQNLLKAKVK